MRERGRDSAAERVADEMRGAYALFEKRKPRRFDQAREARVLAERRQSVAGQVDRERRISLGQQAMHRPPAVEIGAEPVQEHDRRALARLQPQPVNVRRRRRRGRRRPRLDVAPLDAPQGAGPVHARKPQPALPRDPPGGRRRARALVEGRLGESGNPRLADSDRRRFSRRRLANVTLHLGRRKVLALGDDPADAGADRQHVALGRRDKLEDARGRRVDLHRRLVGLDLEQRRALDDMLAFGRMPAAHPAGRHIHVDARHDDLNRHVRSRPAPDVAPPRQCPRLAEPRPSPEPGCRE